MLNNYFTIKEAAEFLNKSISGYTIHEIYTQEKNKLLIELVNEKYKEEKILEYSIEKGFLYLLLKENFSKAKKNYVNLFEDCFDKKIEWISLYINDRVINFELDNKKNLMFTFFSNKANVFLVGDEKVEDSFKDSSDNKNKILSEVISPIKSADKIHKEGLTVETYLKKSYKQLGDLYIKELMYRCRLLREDIIDEDKSAKAENEVRSIERELSEPVFILYTKEKTAHLSLIVLKHLKDYTPKEFENVNELIVEYLKFRYRYEKTEALKNLRLKELGKKIANTEQKLSGLKTQLSHCADSETLRETGDIILQNIDKIKKGDTKFSFRGEAGSDVVIKLKENLSPSENAQGYFEKYKKQKKSVSILKDKIIFMNKEKTKLETELARINEMDEYKSLLKEEKKSEHNKNDETSRFRKFTLNDKYEVWVGKDSATNDLLTTKHAAQNDLWFHVRGASGSHTVLKVHNKKEDVPKEIIHRAAAIAAYYSKARNASSVPVAYCEKKVCEKEKGFQAGKCSDGEGESDICEAGVTLVRSVLSV